MSYQYLFCATCGLRRMGHGNRCTVCDSLLHRVEERPSRAGASSLPPVVQYVVSVRQPIPEPERQPVAA